MDGIPSFFFFPLPTPIDGTKPAAVMSFFIGAEDDFCAGDPYGGIRFLAGACKSFFFPLPTPMDGTKPAAVMSFVYDRYGLNCGPRPPLPPRPTGLLSDCNGWTSLRVAFATLLVAAGFLGIGTSLIRLDAGLTLCGVKLGTLGLDEGVLGFETGALGSSNRLLTASILGALLAGTRVSANASTILGVRDGISYSGGRLNGLFDGPFGPLNPPGVAAPHPPSNPIPDGSGLKSPNFLFTLLVARFPITSPVISIGASNDLMCVLLVCTGAPRFASGFTPCRSSIESSIPLAILYCDPNPVLGWGGVGFGAGVGVVVRVGGVFGVDVGYTGGLYVGVGVVVAGFVGVIVGEAVGVLLGVAAGPLGMFTYAGTDSFGL